jgi:IclR family acetate operon transcriptional repressor
MSGKRVRPEECPQPRTSKTVPGSQVKSLTRALSILDALAQSNEGLTLTTLAQTVRLPLSTTHRLLTTLQHRRFARFDPLATSWQIGVQAFVVGYAFARTRDIVLLARPHMRRLMEESGETVNLYVMSDGEAICMAQVESRQMMRAISRPGGRVMMHHSGAGKAMLAHLPKEEMTRIIRLHGLPRATERTLTTVGSLRADLQAIRSRGFAIDDEEHAVGLRCVAAAVFDELGRPLAGISLSGPTARILDERLDALGARVMEAARATTAEVGGRHTGAII